MIRGPWGLYDHARAPLPQARALCRGVAAATLARKGRVLGRTRGRPLPARDPGDRPVVASAHALGFDALAACACRGVELAARRPPHGRTLRGLLCARPLG